ncbi:MAG: cohesin domain-containing protein, partial [Saprospiraceae bacterium]
MYKIFTSLVALCCCLTFTQTSIAQITFSVVPTEQAADVQVGDTVTINLDVTEFYDVASYQFSVNWNETHIEFESIHNLSLPGMGSGNFGTNNTADGNFTTLWTAPGGEEYSLQDGDTTIFSFDMIITTTAGITTPITITSNPLAFEVIGLNAMGDLDDLTGDSETEDGTATEGMPGGGGDCDFAVGFGQFLNDGSGETGDEVCLTVSACGFTDIEGMQYSINFDPAIVQYQNTENYNLAGLSGGSFNGNNTEGFIVLSWVDSLGTGTTVADGTAIYDVCFTLIGAGGTSSAIEFSGDPSFIEVTDIGSMGTHIGFDGLDGTIDITGNSSSAVTVIASEVDGPVGGQACVQISAVNWDSILAAQYSMHWDTSIIQFASLGNFSGEIGSSDFNAMPSFTDEGTLIFAYGDDVPPNDGSTVPNGTVLYEVCFDIVGEIGESSPFSFDGTPQPIEATQIIDGDDTLITLLFQEGAVNVTPMGSTGELVITASTEEVCPDSIICVSYLATNFDSLIAFEFKVNYDESVLLYQDALSGPTVNELINFNPNSSTAGEIICSWVEGNLDPITFFNDTVIIELCFEAIGADAEESVITWNFDSDIEFINLDGVVPYTLVDGNVTINDEGCNNGLPTPTADITDVDCFGNATGAIDITNSMLGYTYVWTPPTGGIVETDEDQTGLLAGTYSVVVTETASGLTATTSFDVNEPAAALALNLTKTDAPCNDGSDGTATANVTGGTTDYSYLWDNAETTQTINGLSAGEVCVTITDANGCTTDGCITITEGPEITIDISVTPSDCDDDTGSLTATASGGSGTFTTYTWNTMPAQTGQTATGLAPGNYCVIVTDSNGCTAEACEDVGTLDGPTGEITAVVETTCSTTADGSITAAATGGTAPYSFEWTPTDTDPTYGPIPAGTYTVTITDAAGCEDVVSGEVTAGEGITLTMDDSETSCSDTDDGELEVEVEDGTGPYTYAWSPNTGDDTATVTGLEPNMYTVTVTDTSNGCSNTETATVSPADEVTGDVSITSDYNGEDISCFGGSDGEATAEGNGGAGGFIYQWDANADDQDTQTATDLSAGQYTVTITDANGCTTTETVTLSQPEILTLTLTAIDEVNGGDGQIMSDVDGGTPDYDYQWDANAGNATSPNVANLGAGEYCLTVTDDNGCTVSQCATVNGLNALDVSVDNISPESCFEAQDGSFEISSNGVGPFTYEWDSNGSQNGMSNDPNVTNLGQGTFSVTVTDNNGSSGVESGVVVPGPVEQISYTVDKTDVACNGDATGSIGLLIVGGNGGPYPVSWTPNAGSGPVITGLTANTYTPTVTDSNGCTIVGAPIDVVQPESMSISLDSTVDPGCNGEETGEIHVSVTGGTSPYAQFEWFGTGIAGSLITTTGDLTGLGAGTYS